MDKQRLQEEPSAQKPEQAETAGRDKPQAPRKTETGAEVARKVANGAKDEATDRTGRYR